MHDIPLCVDLDGTLLLTDTLAESVMFAATGHPRLLLGAPFWLLRGRACLKQQISAGTALNVASLPLNEAVLAYLKEQHANGRRLILVTSASSTMSSPATA
jgi:hypothetical protein